MPDENILRNLDSVADRVRQHRQVSDRPFVLVEGPDDQITLAPLLRGVDIFPTDGKQNALAAATVLVTWGTDRFACVVDADLYGHQPASPILHRYFPYHEADLEAMLVSMGVLGDLLSHIGSPEKIKACGGVSTLVDKLCKNVAAVTSLRQQNEVNHWSIAFDKVDLASKVDKKTLQLNVNSYCMALLSASRPNTSASQAALLHAAEQMPNGPFAFRGKDVVAFAGVALRATAGSLPHAATAEQVLSSQLRSSAGLRLSQSDWLALLGDLLAA